MMQVHRVTALAPVLAGWLLAGCAAMKSPPGSTAEDPHATAIRTVAMHACDLIRVESPTEIDSLREIMSALNLLLRDQHADWGVISATFDSIPARSKRHLGLSAAMAKQYADNVGGYYDGLRRLTRGCLTALTIDPPGRRSRETGKQNPPPGQPAAPGVASREKPEVEGEAPAEPIRAHRHRGSDGASPSTF